MIHAERWVEEAEAGGPVFDGAKAALFFFSGGGAGGLYYIDIDDISVVAKGGAQEKCEKRTGRQAGTFIAHQKSQSSTSSGGRGRGEEKNTNIQPPYRSTPPPPPPPPPTGRGDLPPARENLAGILYPQSPPRKFKHTTSPPLVLTHADATRQEMIADFMVSRILMGRVEKGRRRRGLVGRVVDVVVVGEFEC